MKFLSTDTLKGKLRLLITVIIIALLLLSSFSYLQIHRAERLGRSLFFSTDYMLSFTEMKRVYHTFLAESVQTDKFFSRDTSESRDSFYVYWEGAHQNFTTIRNKGILDAATQARHDSIEILLDSIKTSFDSLVGLYKFRGMNQYGLAGDINQSSIRLNRVFSKMNDSRFLKQWNRIEKNRHQYIAYGDSLNETSFFKEVKKMKNLILQQIKTSPTSAYLQDVVLLLEQYRSQFQKLAEIDKKIGRNPNQGYRKKIKMLFQRLNYINSDFEQDLITEIQKDIYFTNVILLILSSVIILSVSIFLILFSKLIIESFEKVRDFVLQLVKGKIPEPIHIKTKGDIKRMGEALNNYVKNIRQKVNFADTIGKGNLDTELKMLGEDDDLGKALLEMKKSLLKARQEEQKQEEEDKKRRWANEGIARFNDILRRNIDLETLAYKVISTLVDYLEANQGGLFTYHDAENGNEPYLKLLASYAYNRRKFVKKKIEIGEGLAGICAFEKKPIYMTDLPDDYIEITSGLGKAVPRNIFIVPLIAEEKIFGVLELASLTKFEKYQRDFILRIAETIAGTLNSVKISQQTERLLEESRMQAEENAAKEEEMRQNLEELETTQEEVQRKQKQYEAMQEEVNQLRIELEQKDRQINRLKRKIKTSSK